MVWICFIHIWTPFSDLVHRCGEMGVEFFFIVSGVFLYEGFRKNNRTVAAFVIHRFKRLFPIFFLGILLATCIAILDQWKDNALSLSGMLDVFVPEASMLYEIGWLELPLSNLPGWYVSVLFLGSILVYLLLEYNEKLATHLVLPVLVVCWYSYVFASGKFNFWGASYGNTYVFVPMALFRGIAGIGLGILLVKIREGLEAELVSAGRVINFVSIAALLFLMVRLFFIKEPLPSGLHFFCLVGLVLGCISQSSFLNRLFQSGIWAWLGSLTYGMLMLHIPCRSLINFAYNFFPYYRGIWVIAYILLTVLLSWGVNAIVPRVIPHERQRSNC